MDIIELIIYTSTFFGLFTTIYYLLSYFEKPLIPKQKRSFPLVTIAVPCFNEEKTIIGTLQSLKDLDYPNLEILVVDDGSTDSTFDLAKNFAKNNKIKVFKKTNGGKYTALNLALQKAKGEFFGALDADSFVDPKALKNIIKHFGDRQVTAVTPSMKVHNPKNILQKMQSIEYIIGIFMREILSRLGSIHVTPGPFSIYRKDFFKKFGNYKEAHHTEDIEVALRLQKNQLEIENAPDAFVYTVAPADLRTLFKQRIRWYYGYLMNIIDYKELLNPKHGNLGVVILPSTILSVALLIFSIIILVYGFVVSFVNWFIRMEAIDFKFAIEWTWDPFFIDLSPVTLIAIILVIMSIIIYIIAYRMAKEDSSILSFIIFSSIYGVFFGVWWIITIIRTITQRDIGWGHKSGR